jgi:tetratricopeptide (TPR) repeat protein
MCHGQQGPGAVVAPILLWLALRHPATRARKSQLVLYASLLLVAIGWVVFSLYIGHQSGIILHETAAPASFWLALGAPGHAVERAIAPFFLSPVYEMGGRIDVRSLLTIAVLAALVIAVLRPLWNRKNNNTIANSSLAVSTSFFVAAFLALIPTAGLVRVAQHRADRFLYLPLALFCIGLAPWLERAWRSTTKRWTVLVIAVLSGYAALSYQTLDHWSNDVTLWKAALKEAPEHPIALGQLGALALTQGHFDLAERLLRRSIKRQPAMPKSWSNLGRLYRYRAEKLAASPARKSSAEPQKALYRAAAAAFSKALSFDRDYLSARAELALVRFRLGQREKARRMLEELLEARSPPLSAALYLAEMSWAKDPGAARRLVDKHCRLRADPPACVRWRKKHALTR